MKLKIESVQIGPFSLAAEELLFIKLKYHINLHSFHIVGSITWFSSNPPLLFCLLFQLYFDSAMHMIHCTKNKVFH